MVSHKTLMTSSHGIFMTSQALLWHHRIPLYKTPRLATRGTDLTWGLGFTSVLSSTAGYSCMLGLMRLMHPHFWSLLPSIVFDWVVIIWLLHVDAPRNTLIHPMSGNLKYSMRCPHRTDLLSVGAHEHCSGCKGLHLQKRIATGVTHHPPMWHTSHMYVCLCI